jgi:uncharacterized membrane protein YhaH (DUF805 family)
MSGIVMADEKSPGKTGKKKWWYGIAVCAIVCAFFIGMDLVTTYQKTGTPSITWSVWPVAAVLFFGVAFSLLRHFGTE